MKQLKIAVVLENKIEAGGGFGQAVNALVQLDRLIKNKHLLEIYTSVPENVSYLNALGYDVILFKPSFLDKFVTICSRNDFWELLTRKKKILGTFEKKLIKSDIDLVYFVTPSIRPLALQILNYVYTVWDLCHRDFPEFPEVRNYNELYRRDMQFKQILPAAMLIICDSSSLANQISKRYAIDSEKLVPMPYSHSPFFKKINEQSKASILGKYNLQDGYFFYPAQFWPHKNHYRLLRALKKINESGINRRLVLVGGDKGNLSYINAIIAELGLNNHVSNLGFVPFEHLGALYQGCCAVVMPTYFGPTNLPPFEAWFFEKPLIYSKFCSDQAGDAAEFIDPDCIDSLARAMSAVLSDDHSIRLVERGRIRLSEINQDRQHAENLFLEILQKFSVRRCCWGNYDVEL